MPLKTIHPKPAGTSAGEAYAVTDEESPSPSGADKPSDAGTGPKASPLPIVGSGGKKKKRKKPFLLNPKKKRMGQWDMVMMLLLLFMNCLICVYVCACARPGCMGARRTRLPPAPPVSYTERHAEMQKPTRIQNTPKHSHRETHLE